MAKRDEQNEPAGIPEELSYFDLFNEQILSVQQGHD